MKGVSKINLKFMYDMGSSGAGQIQNMWVLYTEYEDIDLVTTETAPAAYFTDASADECTLPGLCETGSHRCASNAECIETTGSYTCKCYAGYSTANNGITCYDKRIRVK